MELLEVSVRAILGLGVALGGGHFLVNRFQHWLNNLIDLTEEDLRRVRPHHRVPAWLTGLVERLFFAALIAFDAQGVATVATAMIGWLAVKMAANWNRPISQGPDDEDRNVLIGFTFSALITGLVSMIFALVGGLIAAGKIWPP